MLDSAPSGGAVAQLGERQNRTLEVARSIRVGSTKEEPFLRAAGEAADLVSGRQRFRDGDWEGTVARRR